MTEATGPSQLLIEKVLGAALESGYVQKASRHGQGYNYADDEAITTKFREAMLGQGVLVFPEEMDVKHLQVLGGEEGKTPNVLVTIGGHFTVTDGAASFKVSSLGQGIDKGDKAIYKAMTGFKKYAYRHLVMMATGDDPEQARDDETVTSTTRSGEQNRQGRSSNVAESLPMGNADDATQAQKNMLRGRARDAGLTDDERKALLLSTTGLRSFAGLKKPHVELMLKAIESAAQVKAATGGEVVG